LRGWKKSLGQAVKDVTPFLERSQDVKLLTLEKVKNMLLKGTSM